MEREQSFKRGDRVEYTGTLVPSLQGKHGTFKRYDRKGWAIVDFFGDGSGNAKCNDFNLKRIDQ